MKSLIILISLAINFAFANSRFTDADKIEFMKDVKYEIAEFKQDNNGKIDLQIIKPGLYQELDKYYRLQKFTKEEMVSMKEAYEVYSSKAENLNDEEKFYAFVEAQLNEVNKTQVKKIAKGEICNSWVCDEGLRCARDPEQKAPNNKCVVGFNSCKADSDCCSGECVNAPAKKGSKICESIKRCYQPVKLGESCKNVPVCEQGQCLPFDANTIGIGECLGNKKACKNNDECCSGLCESNKCVENIICKDCVSRGQKADKGKKCCEGLIKNSKNICIPDMPPIVPPQVNNSIKTKMFVSLLSIVISNAHADEAVDVVNGNREKYGKFNATSEEADTSTKNMKDASANLTFTKKSNFDTCEMHFREDYYAYLKQNKLFDLEVSLLAFDYMMLGEANHDYWRSTKGSEETSMYGRLSKVAKAHDLMREGTNTKIAEIDRKLTCLCIDVKGVKKASADQASYFNEKCNEFKNAMNSDMNQAACSTLEGEKEAWQKSCLGDSVTMSAEDCDKLKTTLATKEATCTANPAEQGVNNDTTDGDASGVKGKRLLVYYTSQMSGFNQTLTVDNTKIYQGIAGVKTWMENSQEKFSTTDFEYDEGLTLSGFTIKNPSGSAAALGAVLGAILAAGVIAVIGGFATSSMISTWAATGIISAAAASGAGGVWLVASLKGAWITKHPEVYDKFIRSYGCGKKDTCSDYTRMLKQPYSNICDSHIANPACIKNFVTYSLDGEQRYVVDPFIPYGVGKQTILRGQGDYAKSLDAGYNRALDYMRSVSQRGEVGEGVMSSEFIDEYIVGLYTLNPGITDDPESRYSMQDSVVNEIKNKAKAFAVKTKFLEAGDTDNLDKFANYAYEFHFLWPKTTRKKEISYPTVAFDTYLEFMSSGVTANLSAGGSNAALTFGGLNTQYLQDYLNTLKIYAQGTSGLSADQQKSLESEIAATQAAINSNKVIQGLVGDKSNTFGNLSQSAISSAATKSGVSGNVSLTTGQSSFLNAVGTYRKLRNEQLKKLEAYQKATTASGTTSARAASVSSAMKSFGTKFGSGAVASNGGIGSLTSGASSAVKNAESAVSKSSSNSSGSGSLYSTSNGSGSSSRSSSGSSSSASTSAKSSDSAAATETEDEDARKLKEAVEARNKTTAKYNSSNENSLFEKVTNAYIRNYDKVLTKKKQEKDVSDQK